jgi:PncC family amidohydrolase
VRIPIALGKILKKKNCTISFAESITGGALSARIVEAPGASDYFMGGLIAYDNRIKQQFLKVSSKILKEEGAVSVSCAREMAKGIRKLMKTDAGVSVTGIAGPSGATATKPIGLVYAGFDIQGKRITRKYLLDGSRKKIIRKTVQKILKELLKLLSA